MSEGLSDSVQEECGLGKGKYHALEGVTVRARPGGALAPRFLVATVVGSGRVGV